MTDNDNPVVHVVESPWPYTGPNLLIHADGTYSWSDEQ